MDECFEFEGHKIQVSYGLTIDGDYTTYGSAIEAMNPGITWEYREAGSYQGDWFAVGYNDDFGFYYHNGSYGSCTVCDWLNGIDTEEDAIDFLKKMKIIIPIGNKNDAIEYLEKEKENTWGENIEALNELQKWIANIDRKTVASIKFRNGSELRLTKKGA